MDAIEINRRLTFHSVPQEVTDEMASVRVFALMLAHHINNTMTDSKEKSLAMTKLEEAVFWANAGLAREGVDGGS